MAQSTTPSPTSTKQHLLALLDAGSTGCLHARGPHDQMLSVYVMLGEILAVHAADDRVRLLQLLQNGGEVEEARVRVLQQAHRDGVTITEELFEIVPEDTLQELLAERFRENLFLFLKSSPPARFEPLESVFVENIQVGHDSRLILDELEGVAARTARLLDPAGLTLAPGSGTMKDPAHLRLAGLCRPRLPLVDLLVRSPWERSRTLVLVAEMLERGVLVATGGDTTTDRPGQRVVAPAKLTVGGGGRPESAPVREPQSRDAVAAALANAVSAAVAKVGRQREVEAAVSPNREPKSPLDPVSAPMGRRVAPVSVPMRPVPAPPAPPPAPTRPLPAYDVDQPTEEVDDEMAAFQDYDHERVGGEFTTDTGLLDRVELIPAPKPEPTAPEPEVAPNITIEMEDAENATKAELAQAVALNFAGPKLAEDEARRKIEVVNDVFAAVAEALDGMSGSGAGQSRVQLLVEGTPGGFAILFKGVEVDGGGQMPVESVLKNLRKRPASEHRRLLNRGLGELIERALSMVSEELDDEALDALLERVAGYQQRLGM